MKRHKHLVVMLSLVLCMGGAGLAQDARAGATEQDTASLLRYAATQHEIISLLLDEGQYGLLREEFSKILDLGLAGPEEKALTQSAWAIITRLREAQEYELAHAIADDALVEVEDLTNRFSLYMVKAKIYQDQRLFPEAIQLLREAQQLGVDPGGAESEERPNRRPM